MTLTRIYTAGPYSAKSEDLIKANIAQALLFAHPIRRAGAVPCIPHIMVPPFAGMESDEAVWQSAMRECLSHLSTCQGILMLPGYEKSRGAKLELVAAEDWGITVCHTMSEVEALVARAA